MITWCKKSNKIPNLDVPRILRTLNEYSRPSFCTKALYPSRFLAARNQALLMGAVYDAFFCADPEPPDSRRFDLPRASAD